MWRSLWGSVVAGEAKPTMVEFDGREFPAYLAPDVEFGSDRRLRAGRRTDRSVQLALSAAVQAIDQAGEISGTLSVVAGTSRGPQQQWDLAKSELKAGKRLRPTVAATSTVACLSGLISQQLGAEGGGSTVSATCCSGAHAIAAGAQQLLLGEADAVLVGGADAPVHPLVLRGMESAGMLGSACRPFDHTRDGLVVGEGAGFLVLERQSSAKARGAEVLATLASWATGFHAHGRTGICETGIGLTEVVQQSLAMAGISKEEIDYVNAHGTGTELNDRIEAATLAKDFGAEVPVSSTKAITGHCLGATPAIEAIICIEAMRSGIVPATAGLSEVAEECAGPKLIMGEAPDAELRYALSDSIGFWGYHACLVFGAVS